MKSLLSLLSVLMISCIACNRPINITANPDDHTNTSGTLGSSKMTTELPKKSDNMKIPDSLSRTRDSLRKN
jgi:hypothetical protein